MKRKVKGEAGYIAYERVRRAFVVLILFAIPLIAFIASYLYFGTRKNIISVIAMIGFIPACMAAVSLIMVFTIRSIPADLYKRIKPHIKRLDAAYELYLTNGDKNILLDCVAVCNTNVVALNTFKDPDLKEGKTHLENVLRSAGLTSSVIIMNDPDKFIERLDSLNEHYDDLMKDSKRINDERYPEDTREKQVIHAIKTVSL